MGVSRASATRGSCALLGRGHPNGPGIQTSVPPALATDGGVPEVAVSEDAFILESS